MTRIFILLSTLLFSIASYSQGNGDYTVYSKALDIGVYKPKKVAKYNYKVYYDEEAEREFEKILLKDKELRELFIYELVDNDGNPYSIREREVYEFYPEVGVIVEGGGHGFISAFDINTKKEICGNPTTYAYSPSGQYRLSGLSVDDMYYFLEKKIDNEYVCLGRVYFDGTISGYYWNDNETIYYLRERLKSDQTKYWVAYSGRFRICEF